MKNTGIIILKRNLNVTLIFAKVSTKVSHDCMWKHDHREKQLLKVYSNQDKINKN